MNYEQQFLKIQKKGFEIFQKKNKDYGNSFETYGPIGVIVRMGDKINRLMSVSKNKITMIEDEKIEDTLMDLQNYCTIALMIMKQKE